jgi:multiple sugar transport system substrate-binding protein
MWFQKIGKRSEEYLNTNRRCLILKKYILLFVVLILALTGCASETTTKSKGEKSKKEETKEITFTIFNDGVGVDQKLVDEFNKSHDKIHVTYRPIAGTELQDRLITWMAAKDKSLDVVGLDVVWTNQFAKAGWIVPIEDYISDDFKKEIKDNFIQAPVKAQTIDKKLYAVPWNTNGGLIYYRKDLLKKYGFEPPATMDELVQQAEEISKKEGIYGYVGQFKRYEAIVANMTEFFEAYGGGIIDDKGKIIVNSKENLEALKTVLRLKKVMPAGANTYVEKESQETFLNGSVAFLRAWTNVWNLAQADGSKVKDKVGMIPFPGDKEGKAVSTLGGWNLAVSAYSENKEAATEFIQWLADKERQKIKANEGGRLPVLKSLYEDTDVTSKNPAFKEFYDVLVNGVMRPKVANYSKVSDIIQNEMSLAFTGDKTPEQALKDLQQQLEETIK